MYPENAGQLCKKAEFYIVKFSEAHRHRTATQVQTSVTRLMFEQSEED